MIAGHYRVLDRIGSGGMGVVWRARDERLQRVVAVKQLWLQPGLSAAETANARQRTLREARIAARLQHSNAIVVFDVAEHEGEPCLVLEYMASRSLAMVLAERRTLPPAEAAAIGRQVASALAAAHAAGIVHRDVKPGNILIDDAGIAKITDFGVSRAAGDVTVTQTGMMTGTPAYLAPEVARGQEPLPASDVFSLGATLYAAVEGRAPFGTTQNQLAMLHAAAAGYVEPPQQAGPLGHVLMDLMREDPAQRPDMVTATAALAAAASGSTPAAMPQLLSRPAAPGGYAAHPRTLLHSPAPAHPSMPPQQANRQPVPQRTHQPPPPRPGPSPGAGTSGPRRRRVLLGSALVAVVLAGLVGVFSLRGSETGGTDQAAAQPPAATQPAPPPPPAPSPAAVEPEVSEGDPIEYSPAGELVIDYYNGLDDPASAWAMLSPGAQATFGSQAAFEEYWSQFSSVSARNANGVTTNADGTVTVPVDVSYDGMQSTRELRITRIDGELLIDSDPR